jgi:hypothetical protein
MVELLIPQTAIPGIRLLSIPNTFFFGTHPITIIKPSPFWSWPGIYPKVATLGSIQLII